MRITTSMMQRNLLDGVDKNLQVYSKIQEQINTEKRINKPSDDPVGSSVVNSHRIDLKGFEKYEKNLDEAQNYLGATEEAISQLNNVVVSALQTAELQSTETSNPESKKIAAEEISQLIDQSFEIANTSFRDRYLFSGFKTSEPPYSEETKPLPIYKKPTNTYDGEITISGESNAKPSSYQIRITEAGDIGTAKYQISSDNGETWSDEKTLYSQNSIIDPKTGEDTGLDLTFENKSFAKDDMFKLDIVRGKYQGDDGIIKYNFSYKSTIQTNVTGKEIFEDNAYFDTLYKLKSALENNNTIEISEALSSLKEIQSNLQSQTSKIGAWINRAEISKNNLQSMQKNISDAISNIEDTDMIQAISDLALQETALEASVNVLSKAIPVSLLNYI